MVPTLRRQQLHCLLSPSFDDDDDDGSGDAVNHGESLTGRVRSCRVSSYLFQSLFLSSRLVLGCPTAHTACVHTATVRASKTATP